MARTNLRVVKENGGGRLTHLLDLLPVLVLLVVFAFRHIVGLWTMKNTIVAEWHCGWLRAEVDSMCSSKNIKGLPMPSLQTIGLELSRLTPKGSLSHHKLCWGRSELNKTPHFSYGSLLG